MKIGMLPSTRTQLVVRKRSEAGCLDYEVKKGNKVVKKEHIVALKGELYFVKFIINPKEDDVEPGVIFGGPFIRLVNGIVDFGSGVISVYPEQDLFEDDFEKTEKSMEEATKEALALRISQEFALLEEVRPVLKTMAYNDKYKKVLDEIWKDKVELDGMIIKEEEEAINKVKGEALKEKDDPRAFIFPIKFEVKINENALADTGSDINTMPYRIYAKLGREEITKTMGGNDDEGGSSRSKRSRQYETVEEVLLPQVHHEFLLWEELCHEFYSTYEFDEVCADDELQTKKIIKFRLGGRTHSLTLLEFAHRLGLYHAEDLDEEGFDVYFQGGLCSDDHFNAQEYWLSISRKENLSLSRSHVSNIRSSALREIHKIITYCLCQRTTGDLDTTTLRELIDSEGRLIPKDLQPGVPRVAIPRPPRALMYVGVFEHMARVYSVPLQGAYNPPGYAQPQYDQYYQQYPPQQ
ncbi:hypothetical protein Tco_0205020 [Tanacetum coccineum]